MSRTYRKNIRHLEKAQGKLYSYWTDRSLNGNKNIIQITMYDLFTPYRISTNANAWLPWGCSTRRLEVKVSDGDNIHRGPTKDWKRIAHKKNRARFRQALIRDQDDPHFTNAINPWMWD